MDNLVKIAFVKNNVIVTVAEFDSVPENIEEFMQIFDADTFVLDTDERVVAKDFSSGNYLEPSINKFIKNKPYPSWTISDSFEWIAPISKPGPGYFWDEDSLSWIEANSPTQ